MSLLGTQVFANPATPIWIGANGGNATNLDVDGVLKVTGAVQVASTDTGAVKGIITTGQAANNTLYLQTDSRVAFGQIGTANVNSYVQVSAFGSGGDLLVVGGTISADAIGPPTQIIETPQTTTLLAAITDFTADNVVATNVNQEFDINVKLEFGLTAGAYTPGDTVTVYITCDGTPTYQDKGSWEYEFLAGGATGAATNFKVQIRDRFICTNPAAEIKCGVKKTVTNPVTAIDCTCEQFDCVRVK